MSDLAHAIVEIVRSVCTSVLDLEVAVACEADEPAEPQEPRCRGLISRVEIAGRWSGAVVLRCDDGFACECAAILFDGEPCGEAEQRDAFGELANMVAGNLKTLLPAPSQLSLPSVTSTSELAVVASGGRELEHVHFRLANGWRLTVELVALESPDLRGTAEPTYVAGDVSRGAS